MVLSARSNADPLQVVVSKEGVLGAQMNDSCDQELVLMHQKYGSKFEIWFSKPEISVLDAQGPHGALLTPRWRRRRHRRRRRRHCRCLRRQKTPKSVANDVSRHTDGLWSDGRMPFLLMDDFKDAIKVQMEQPRAATNKSFSGTL